jgi:hypothetical protein
MLHLERSFVWCWNLDTSESGSEIPQTFRFVVLEKMGKISWTNCVKNEKVLQRFNKEMNNLHAIKRLTR